MAVSKRVRFEVFKRDRFTCAYCGRRPPEVLLEVDHVVPRCEGGPDTIDNLVTSCEACNRGKAGKSLGDVAPHLDELQILEGMQEMAERTRALRSQIEVAERQRALDGEVVDLVMKRWESIGGDVEDRERDRQHRGSVLMFLKKGLSVETLYQALDLTSHWWDRFPNKGQGMAWRYFCGCCWNILRESGAPSDG